MDDPSLVPVFIHCAYYQGNRVVEHATCGECHEDVFEDETYCENCGAKLDWEDQIESMTGMVNSYYF